jgi:hypothetical protein
MIDIVLGVMLFILDLTLFLGGLANSLLSRDLALRRNIRPLLMVQQN